MDNSTSGLGKSKNIVIWNSTSAEDTSVSEVLSGKITNGELGKNDLSLAGNNLVELFVDKSPLGIDNLLEVLGVVEANFCVFSLSLKFEL